MYLHGSRRTRRQRYIHDKKQSQSRHFYFEAFTLFAPQPTALQNHGFWWREHNAWSRHAKDD
jgi:hypothetical protein